MIDALPRAVIVTDTQGRFCCLLEPVCGGSVWLVRGRDAWSFRWRSVGAVAGSGSGRRDHGRDAAGRKSWQGDFTVLRRDQTILLNRLWSTHPSLGSMATWWRSWAHPRGVAPISDYREKQAADVAEHLSLALDAGESGNVAFGHGDGHDNIGYATRGAVRVRAGDFRRDLRGVCVATASR